MGDRDRVADPKALGYAAYAILAWMAAVVYAGWAHVDVSLLHDVALFATYALLIAALASFLRGEAWHAVFFMFWSAFSLNYESLLARGLPQNTVYGGWFDISIALVSLFLFLASLRLTKLPVKILTAAVTLAFVAFGLADWTGAGICMLLGGYLTAVSALAAFWATADAFAAMRAAVSDGALAASVSAGSSTRVPVR